MIANAFPSCGYRPGKRRLGPPALIYCTTSPLTPRTVRYGLYRASARPLATSTTARVSSEQIMRFAEGFGRQPERSGAGELAVSSKPGHANRAGQGHGVAMAL